MESKERVLGRKVQKQGVFRDQQVIQIELEGIWEAKRNRLGQP